MRLVDFQSNARWSMQATQEMQCLDVYHAKVSNDNCLTQKDGLGHKICSPSTVLTNIKVLRALYVCKTTLCTLLVGELKAEFKSLRKDQPHLSGEANTRWLSLRYK